MIIPGSCLDFPCSLTAMTPWMYHWQFLSYLFFNSLSLILYCILLLVLYSTPSTNVEWMIWWAPLDAREKCWWNCSYFEMEWLNCQRHNTMTFALNLFLWRENCTCCRSWFPNTCVLSSDFLKPNKSLKKLCFSTGCN